LTQDITKWIEEAKAGNSYRKSIEQSAEFANPELVQVHFM